MRILICGSRSIADQQFVIDTIEAANFVITEVVVGDARGVDAIAAAWARHHGIPVEVFYADWDRFGKSAGYRRNNEMVASEIDGTLAIWDGFSRGTRHTIDLTLNLPQIPVIIAHVGWAYGSPLVEFVECEECPF